MLDGKQHPVAWKGRGEALAAPVAWLAGLK
jgi:hypothetical protein